MQFTQGGDELDSVDFSHQSLVVSLQPKARGAFARLGPARAHVPTYVVVPLPRPMGRLRTDDLRLKTDDCFPHSSTGCTQRGPDFYLHEIVSRCRVEVGKALGP